MTSNPIKAPISIREANPVIVGGGPCGSFTALALQARGIPVTLIESAPDFSNYDPSRTYTISINWRGRQALDSIPGLLQHLYRESVATKSDRFLCISPDGKRTSFFRGRGISSPDGRERLCFLRPHLSESMRSFVDKTPGINVLYGTTVKRIDFNPDGEVQLHLETDSHEHILRSRLVLACDGVNSTVGREIDQAASEGTFGNLFAPKGFGRVSYHAPCVGMKVKTVVVRPHLRNTAETQEGMGSQVSGTDTQGTLEGTIVEYKGERKRRNSSEIFNIVLYDLPGKTVRELNGNPATIFKEHDHQLWKLNDIEEAYRLFEINFPQLDVREAIEPDVMKAFISSKPMTLRNPVRRKSLAVHIGTSKQGGALFFGDAAHRFLPFFGQGVNSGFQDAAVFAQLIDGPGKDGSLEDLLRQYVEVREAETDALMKIGCLGSPIEHRNDNISVAFVTIQTMLRARLSKLLPGLIHPTLRELILGPYSLPDVIHMEYVTRRRVLALVSIPLLTMFLALLQTAK